MSKKLKYSRLMIQGKREIKLLFTETEITLLFTETILIGSDQYLSLHYNEK